MNIYYLSMLRTIRIFIDLTSFANDKRSRQLEVQIKKKQWLKSKTCIVQTSPSFLKTLSDIRSFLSLLIFLFNYPIHLVPLVQLIFPLPVLVQIHARGKLKTSWWRLFSCVVSKPQPFNVQHFSPTFHLCSIGSLRKSFTNAVRLWMRTWWDSCFHI